MARTGLFSPRGLAAFAGGATVALIADRLLPPLISQTAASLDTARGKDPLAVLVDDHRHFLDLLDQMEQSRGRSDLYRTQLLLRLKRRLAAHALAEEDVIYPLLHEQAHAEAAARQLYAEHGMIKTHLYALEQTSGEEAAFISRAATLRTLVERHARQEEGVEFPRLREILDEDAAARMARHVRREKAMLL